MWRVVDKVMSTQQHWEGVYRTKAPSQVSWFRPHLETSLALIEHATQGNRASAIVDVGGGPATLVDDLLARGYRNLTVLDISHAALEFARERLGERANSVTWLCADVTEAKLPVAAFDVWHDRAVFHFLASPEQRLGYVRTVTSALKPGGHAVISTFGPAGPMKCSGLDVVRYDSETLSRELGERFRLIESSIEVHTTPSGAPQQFLSCLFTME